MWLAWGLRAGHFPSMVYDGFQWFGPLKATSFRVYSSHFERSRCFQTNRFTFKMGHELLYQLDLQKKSLGHPMDPHTFFIPSGFQDVASTSSVVVLPTRTCTTPPAPYAWRAGRATTPGPPGRSWRPRAAWSRTRCPARCRG